MVDMDAVKRVLGVDVEERFGYFTENAGDLYEVPGLLCEAYEALQLHGGSLSHHVGELLTREGY
jgi:hypothetical protein